VKTRTPKGPERENERQIEAERLLLGAICQQTLDATAREDVLRHFASRKFARPEHQVVFKALSQIPAREPAIIREVLATRLTVMGFPDLDVSAFFDAPPLPDRKVFALLRLL
jgi:hypothetical protein